jgi:hypothetical protein
VRLCVQTLVQKIKKKGKKFKMVVLKNFMVWPNPNTAKKKKGWISG